MHIIVLGAGITGVACAYYLNQLGHQVTVIDRADDVAMETSFANAGQLSFAYTTPWASPSIPTKVMKWLFKKHSPLIIRPDGSLFQLQWLTQMLTQCSSNAYARNQSRMLRISEYSRALFDAFENQHPDVHFDQRSLGLLHLFRQPHVFEQQLTQLGELERYNIPHHVLDSLACLEYEPALAHMQSHIAGAIYLPKDKTGDCHRFAQKLADLCKQNGVQFKLNQNIKQLNIQKNRVTSVILEQEEISGDAYLCALGSFSRPMLQQIGLNVPIYPVKGYSLTIPIIDESRAPRSTVLDETYKVALTRFDDRIRVGGMAELSGYTLQLPQARRETLEQVTQELFPQSGNLAQATFWSGLRPVTPDSTPIIGATRFENLFTNTGHGTLGWTMSLGSGKLIADLIHSGKGEIEHEDLSIARYS